MEKPMRERKEKKKFISPKMEIVEMESNTALLAGSGDEEHGHHGHENACAHGSHAWFCDD
jgi:hypothetical protein